MNHLILFPVLLPAVVGAIIILVMRFHTSLARTFSVATSLALLGIGWALLWESASGRIMVYDLGNWPAPFGIVLVLDRLSALMVLMTALLALAALFYAITSGWDARGRHFHALFQFQLMGVCGAFLTGDVFNLFVFFEVLLIASYGLMLHGGGAARLKAGMQYVVINLAGSTLFLFAVGAIYAVTGTLNMADLAVKAPLVAPADAALLRVGGLLLLLVFAVKAALVPLHFWLPGAYGQAPAPVAALFAIMTKVGAYSILRVYTLIFGAGAGDAAWLAQDWLLPAALVTLALGTAGILGARSLTPLVCFSVIASMGTVLIGVGLFTQTATVAALYYMIHSTFAAATLFLIAELVCARRGAMAGRLNAAPPLAQGDLMAGLFFLGAIAMAGMPPLSGFLGKLMVLAGAQGRPDTALVWAVILVTSLLTIIGFARAGSVLFWKSAGEAAAPQAWPAGPVVAASAMLAALAALTVFAGPVERYLDATAAQLYAPSAYIEAVLGETALAAR